MSDKDDRNQVLIPKIPIVSLAPTVSIKCAECHCTPRHCMKTEPTPRCSTCTKRLCCCTAIHSVTTKSMAKMTLTVMSDDCCASGTCKNDMFAQKTTSQSELLQFFKNTKSLYAAALGIEILCITAAEIGENTGLYLFGFNLMGIPIAYAMGYALAGFAIFATILGRYNYGSNDKIDSCCSVLEQETGSGFIQNIKATFRNFTVHC